MDYQKDSQFCALKVEEPLKERITLDTLTLLHGAMGICTEVSEINEAYSNENFAVPLIDVVNLREEVGDICWYVAYIANALDYELDWGFGESEKSDYQADIMGLYADNHELSIVSGKILDSLKRNIFYGVEINVDELKENVSKLVPILCRMAYSAGADFSVVAKKNIEKLRKRYDEKFSEEAAVKRDLDAEREVLESE